VFRCYSIPNFCLFKHFSGYSEWNFCFPSSLGPTVMRKSLKLKKQNHFYGRRRYVQLTEKWTNVIFFFWKRRELNFSENCFLFHSHREKLLWNSRWFNFTLVLFVCEKEKFFSEELPFNLLGASPGVAIIDWICHFSFICLHLWAVDSIRVVAFYFVHPTRVP